ncbi:MAG TPA: ABC transporter permease [Conexibacter sp.]|nr:ABC transporter permease [Conexibacter sp.]
MNHSTVMQFVLVAIAAGTPIIFATVGETLAQRSGVMNLGIEGVMLLSAAVAFWTASTTHSLLLGVLAAAVAGALAYAMHAVWAISLRVDQIVLGLAMLIVCTGLSEYIGSAGGEHPLATRSLPGTIGPVLHGGLASLPLVGPIVFGQDVLVYLSWIFVAGASFYLFRTRAGLWVRSVGEDPATADAVGISVVRTRYLHVIAAGALVGVGGSYVTLALFGAWKDGITAGQGWLAFTIVLFSGWRPYRGLVAAYLFGGITSIGFKLQLFHIPVPSQILTLLPYLLTLIALVLLSRRTFVKLHAQPAALGEPFWRESR